jgi:hypothetical protein
MKLEEYKKQYADIETDVRAGHITTLIGLGIALIASIVLIILFYTKVMSEQTTTSLGWGMFGFIMIMGVEDSANCHINQRKINKLNLMYLEELEERKGE